MWLVHLTVLNTYSGFCCLQEKPQDGQSSDSGALAQAPYVKHPLQNKWALWFYKTDKAKSWKDNLRLVTSFDTVSLTDFCT